MRQFARDRHGNVTAPEIRRELNLNSDAWFRGVVTYVEFGDRQKSLWDLAGRHDLVDDVTRLVAVPRATFSVDSAWLKEHW